MKKKNRLLIAVALGALVTSGAALACPDGTPGFCPGGEPTSTSRQGPGPHANCGTDFGPSPMMHLVKRLDLTSDQDAKIRTILKDDALSFQRDDKQVQAHRDAIHDLLTAKTFNVDRARAIVKDETRQMTQKRVSMLQTEYKIYQVLTLDQRAQLDKMLSDGPRVAQPISNDVPPPPPRP